MKSFLFLFILLFVFSGSSAQSASFQKKINVPGSPFARVTDFDFCADGGFIFSCADSDSAEKMTLMKFDSLMNFQWAKSMEGPGESFDHPDVGVLPSGGYYLFNYSLFSVDYFLTVFDSVGNVQWSKKYDSGPSVAGVYYQPKAMVLANGDFLLSFNTNRMWLARTNSSGDLLWSNICYNDILKNPSFDAVLTEGGGSISCGKSDMDKMFVKTSASGTIEWTKILDSPKYYHARTMSNAADGNILVAGLEQDNIENKGFVMKMDTMANPIWYKNYTHPTGIYFINILCLQDGKMAVLGLDNYDLLPVVIFLNSDGSIISATRIGVGSTGASQFYKIKISPRGDLCVLYHNSITDGTESNFFKSTGTNLNWCGTEPYNLTAVDVIYNPAIQNSATTLQAGTATGFSFGSANITVTAENYCTTAIQQSGDSSPAISIFPNPAQAQVAIRIENKTESSETFTLTDAMGRLVLEKNLSGNETTMDISNLSPGIYFYEVTDASGRIGTGKLMIE